MGGGEGSAVKTESSSSSSVPAGTGSQQDEAPMEEAS